jgi:hypothetical protein
VSKKDLSGSVPDFVAEAEDTTAEGPGSMLHGESKKRGQAEREASDERKEHRQAKREAKTRIRELEQKLKLQEASSSLGDDRKK